MPSGRALLCWIILTGPEDAVYWKQPSGVAGKQAMKIRSLTVGVPLRWPFAPTDLDDVGAFARELWARLTDGGYEVQTVRLAGPPLSTVLAGADGGEALAYARALETAARERGFEYVSVGPVRILDAPSARRREAALDLINVLPELVRATEVTFCSVLVASHNGGVHLPAVERTAAAITAIARTTPDGFGNLRFAALANCPPHIPFFPAAYHEGSHPRYALALEAADVAVEAFTNAASLDDARRGLIAALDGHWQRLERILRPEQSLIGEAAGGAAVAFGGVDLSLAPFPDDERSIAVALERLGVARFGASGTLFAAAVLTSALGSAHIPRTGYSGLMLPVLEDSRLAQRASEGLVSVDSLLLYAAVCGLGLDTVPVPGDTCSDELAAIILDMATLAARLDKPLTARLFPVPGARAGDPVAFDFPYFAPSRVLSVRGLGAAALLAKGEVVRL